MEVVTRMMKKSAILGADVTFVPSTTRAPDAHPHHLGPVQIVVTYPSAAAAAAAAGTLTNGFEVLFTMQPMS